MSDFFRNRFGSDPEPEKAAPESAPVEETPVVEEATEDTPKRHFSDEFLAGHKPQTLIEMRRQLIDAEAQARKKNKEYKPPLEKEISTTQEKVIELTSYLKTAGYGKNL